MSYAAWLNYLRMAEKTSILRGNIRKVHYKFHDGAEMLEDYSLETGMLVRRSWKIKRSLLTSTSDELQGDLNFGVDIEVGDAVRPLGQSEFLVKESVTEV